MIYDGGWPYLTRGRALALILALIGVGWLLLRVTQPAGLRLSSWGGRNPFAQGSTSGAAVSADQQGLTGISLQQVGRGMGDDTFIPQGNPLQAENMVVTQGYAVGSHAPAEVWGGIDLALDGNGDGQADPQGSMGQPVYATHAGTVTLAAGSWPAGNFARVVNDRFRTGYGHLNDFAVADGQQVQPGDLIGHIGTTGQSSGPHLHYDVWELRDGKWVNLNPFDFAADGAK